MRALAGALTALVVTVPVLASVADEPAAAAECDPFTTPAAYAGDVPTHEEVNGFPLGTKEVSTAESDAYVEAVDSSSDRVSSGVLATSHQGRRLVYAVVGDSADVLAAKRAANSLRDPRTTREEAATIAADSPAIAWVAGNVHGNEESGTDAALQLLHDLADRTDCAAAQIRDNTVVAILPTQNPDGREADTRRNAYGFDMNRDWFARTQPETDGKLELLRELTPVLFIDDHEMGADDYFFPPNADPAYHDIADRSIGWINDLYGAAMVDEFDRQDIPFFNYDIYDLFYMGYGDTVPTTGFLGAGMTFEKNSVDPIDQRVHEQFTAVWASVSALALDKEDVLTGWAASHRRAVREGRRGELQPNQVFAPGNTVQDEVPDIKVRHYFIENSDADKRPEVRALVRRLQRMDVEVRRLTAPLRVPDYTPYGRESRAATLPAGTFWVTMAQSQKHWVQAMLNETTYVPFPYFYDVTAWSGPLLFNVAGGRSGRVLRPESSGVAPVAEPAPPARPADANSVGLWQLEEVSTSGVESSGWMRWLFDKKWRVPFREVSTVDIAEGGLEPVDALVVPNGDAETAYQDLGADGRKALREWLADGGRFVGLRGGTELAARMQLTTAQLKPPKSDVPGSLIRARVADGPLGRGVGNTAWSFYEYDNVMTVTDPRSAAVSYPDADSRAFFVSGFEEGAEELGGTAALVDERYGDGRVVVFAGEPNYRAFTDGTQKILWNALYGPDPSAAASARLSSAEADRARASSARAAEELVDLDNQLVLTVRAGAAESAATVLGEYDLQATTQQLPGAVRYIVDVGSGEESPVARKAARDLAELGPAVVALRVP